MRSLGIRGRPRLEEAERRGSSRTSSPSPFLPIPRFCWLANVSQPPPPEALSWHCFQLLRPSSAGIFAALKANWKASFLFPGHSHRTVTEHAAAAARGNRLFGLGTTLRLVAACTGVGWLVKRGCGGESPKWGGGSESLIQMPVPYSAILATGQKTRRPLPACY